MFVSFCNGPACVDVDGVWHDITPERLVSRIEAHMAVRHPSTDYLPPLARIYELRPENEIPFYIPDRMEASR